MGSAKRPNYSTPSVTQARSAKRNPREAATAPGGSPVLWFDGSDINLTSNSGMNDGDPIGTWKNKGSGGATYDVTQAVAGSKPLYRVNKINGKSGVVYDNVDDTLKCSTGCPFTASSARHLFFVARSPTFSTYLCSWQEGTYYSTMIGNTSPKIHEHPTATNLIGAAIASGTDVIVEVVYDGVTTNLVTCRVNGVAQTVTQGSGTGVGAEVFAGVFYIGFRFAEVICDAICYSGVQDAGTAAATRAYLTSKYGIAA